MGIMPSFTRSTPATELMLLLLVLLVFVFISSWGRWRNYAKNFIQALVIAVLSWLAMLSLMIASFNPTIVTEPDYQEYHLVLVIDVSESALRQGAWPVTQTGILNFLQQSLNDLSPDIALDSPVTILTFGDGVQRSEALLGTPTNNVFNAVSQLNPNNFADSSETDIEEALFVAKDILERSGRRGEIILVSDGNETQGSALNAAVALSQIGIPITVLPISAAEPSLAITAINLPTQVESERDTNLRLLVYNNHTDSATASLKIVQNMGLQGTDSLFGEELSSESVPFEIPSAEYRHRRQNILFQGLGIQYVDASLFNVQGEVLHQRRLFSHVLRPLQILAYGNMTWVSAVSEDRMIVQQETNPESLETIDLSRYDAVVISELNANNFSEESLERLALTVRDDGLGFMLINGSHEGASPETPTILRSYDTSAIEPILPVSTDPMEVQDEPPPRNIIIFIDRSGSMADHGGYPFQAAKDISRHIINTQLRPVDRLIVIAFDTAATVVIDACGSGNQICSEGGRIMNDNGRREAINAIEQLTIGGGTDPEPALALLPRRNIENCALIFMSDGFFQVGEQLVAGRPDCHATVFGMNPDDIDSSNPLYYLADPIHVSRNYDTSSLVIPYFRPQIRDYFFEPGTFIPLGLNVFGTENNFVPDQASFAEWNSELRSSSRIIPNLMMEGSAISQAIPERNPEILAIRPRPRDIILAYRQEGMGIVGVLTTGIPESWANFEAGRSATEQWIMRTVGYYERDRYLFNVSDTGLRLSIELEIHNQDGGLADVQSIDMAIQMDERSFDGMIQEIGAGMASFRAEFENLPRLETAQNALLIVSERSGTDILPRPQRIPILIPPSGLSNASHNLESSSYGTRVETLQRIAEISNGVFAPNEEYRLFESGSRQREIFRFWRYLVILAAFLYLTAIGLKRLWS